MSVPAAARDPYPRGEAKHRDEDERDARPLTTNVVAPTTGPPNTADDDEAGKAAKAARRAARKDAHKAEIAARGLYTQESLANALGISRVHLRRLVGQGKVPAPFYATDRRPMWRQATIEHWMCELERTRSITGDAGNPKAIT